MPRRLILAALAGVLLAGCAVAPTPNGAASRVRVVAAEGFWGDLAAQVGGDRAQVVSLISSPDIDPHSYEPTASDARAVAMAQVLVVNGLGYDAWAARLAAANPAQGRVPVDVGKVLGLPLGTNPHRWYSPPDVGQVVRAIATALTTADPAHAPEYEANAGRLLTTGFADYDSELTLIRARYAGVPVGASESIFAPLATYLGLDLVTPPGFLRAVSEGTDPTAADLLVIDQQLAGHELKVYVENVQNLTPDVASQARGARMAGIPVVDVTETLVPAGASFQQWQTDQLRHLAAALKEATGR